MTQNSSPGKAGNVGDGSILINFVLDKSGSMEAIRSATISGFNEFKNDQTRESGEALLTLTLFDTGFRTVCEAVPLREVPDLDLQSYQPGGMTALYDAIGYTMRIADEYVAAHNPHQVLFVIMTDGEENSSREFSRDRIFRMIEERRARAEYEFVYLGANQDSYRVASSMGVADGHAIDFDGGSPFATAETMKQLSHEVRGHRRTAQKQTLTWFDGTLAAEGADEPEEYERKKKTRPDVAPGGPQPPAGK